MLTMMLQDYGEGRQLWARFPAPEVAQGNPHASVTLVIHDAQTGQETTIAHLAFEQIAALYHATTTRETTGEDERGSVTHGDHTGD